MTFFDLFRKKRGSKATYHQNLHESEGGIYFEGGNGESVEMAIVVRGARHDLVGTYAEFAWLTQMNGQKDRDWRLLSQSHGNYEGRDIDTFIIQKSDGIQHSVFFDCTESFGKL